MNKKFWLNASCILKDRLWYRQYPLRWLLYPLAMVYQMVSLLRRFYLKRFHQTQFPVPIIVVGNLTMGGTGKTPLVIALAKQFCAQGLRVGIVSRGYGANIRHFPYEVQSDETAERVGDEPLLLAEKTASPVVIAPKRVQAVQYLLDKYQSQIIISDDGLQHYAMARAIEIVVIDGLRGLGNGLCLPAGPLREGVNRLKSADFLVVNAGDWPDAHRMDLIPGPLTQLVSGNSIQPSGINTTVAAIAGIGNPQRFFATLNQLGVPFKAYPFADHYSFKLKDLHVAEKMMVMTEKDAVKCQAFATDKMYFLPVKAKLSQRFWEALFSHEQLAGLNASFKRCI